MLKKSKKKWSVWLKTYDSVLKSSVFKDYEDAENAFFNSYEYHKYRDAERDMLWNGLLMYLGDDLERQYDLHGTPKYIRWVPKLFKDEKDR